MLNQPLPVEVPDFTVAFESGFQGASYQFAIVEVQVLVKVLEHQDIVEVWLKRAKILLE